MSEGRLRRMKNSQIGIEVLVALFTELDELVGHTVEDARWLAAALCTRSAAHSSAAMQVLARHLPCKPLAKN